MEGKHRLHSGGGEGGTTRSHVDRDPCRHPLEPPLLVYNCALTINSNNRFYQIENKTKYKVTRNMGQSPT